MDEQQNNLSEYERERRGKRDKLRELGVDPYGSRVEQLKPLNAVKESYVPEMGHDAGPVVRVAGRVMFAKRFGKLAFITLRDETGDLQVALDKKRLNELDWQVQELIDLADQIVVEGALGTTKTGEVTVWATSVQMASKAILPPPSKWDGLSDVEARYRQRYVDLWANPGVMRTLKLRIQIVEEIRTFMRGRGYLEVETPMMQTLHGGAAARPFITHHNALDTRLYLRIAPELYLKRLLVGGFTKIFELNRNFRNEGISTKHNPEFTMLEAYEAYGSWETMADLVESMICHIAEKLFGGLTLTYGERVVNLSRPWRRAPMAALVEERTGSRFDQERGFRGENSGAIVMMFGLEYARRFVAQQQAAFDAPQPAHFPLPGEDPIAHFKRMVGEVGWAQMQKEAFDYVQRMLELSPAEQLVEVYEKLIEPTLIDPCFVTHVPSVAIPLARKVKDDPFFADAYELAINGVEVSPGYTELNDPDVQAANFQQQVGEAEEQMKPDEDFLNALKYGMPPAGGMGMGIDRLVMMLTGAESIRDVILFPLMKVNA